MTNYNLLRIEVYKSNVYLSILKCIARKFGGDVGREIISSINEANWEIDRYEKAINRIDTM